MDTLNLYEASLLYQLNQTIANPILDQIMGFISRLGDSGWFFALIALVLLAIPKTRRQGVLLAVALILDMLAVNILMKPLIARARPFAVLEMIQPVIPLPGDFSFPSGHTAVSFAAAFAMQPAGNRIFRFFLTFACLMGLSRVYLMVHYPTDVLCGALVGSLFGICALWLWKKAESYGKIKR